MEQPMFSSSESDIPNAINLDDSEISVFNNNDNDNPSSGNSCGNGDVHNNGGGGNVGNTTTPNSEGSVYDREGNGRLVGMGASFTNNAIL